ncbi:MAG: 3-oxoacyl-ACP reductase FabG [Bacteriovoracaceae bacterium]|nr:3-oxoacyl-ACP reductase FabG [Bacteriovoracaceae bacterium]
MFSFEGQHIIVTGGTRGIGRGICEAFLKSGGTVIATYAGNEQAAKEFKEANSKHLDRLDVKKFDVSNFKEVEEFFEYVDDNYPSIEVLVNNSGIRKDSMCAMMDNESWDQVLRVNLNGTFYMSKMVVPRFMKKRFGRIINISSIGWTLGLPGQTNYGASKAGQEAFAMSLSKEVAKKGITVNNICPGFIETDFIADLPAEQKKEYAKQVPMKRFGSVTDVAAGVLFLASKEASYITGSSLKITGGL